MQHPSIHECPSQSNAEVRTCTRIIGSRGDAGKGLHESLTSNNSESQDETMAHTQLIKLDSLERVLNTAPRSFRPISQPNFPLYTFCLIELLADL